MTNPLANVLSINPLTGIVTTLAQVEQGNLIMPLATGQEDATELAVEARKVMNHDLIVSVDHVTFADGFTVKVGDTVRFSANGANGYGEVIAIPHHAPDKVRILPDETRTFYSARGRYALNDQAAARHGFPDFVEIRDRGVSGGCIMRPNQGWAEPGPMGEGH